MLPRLNGAASVRAEECVESFSHTRPDGSSFSSILTSGTYAVNWTAVGENIAWGQRTPAAVMDAWMNSAGHKANILSEKYEFDYIGVGVARDSSGVLYWTQNFVRCSESFSDAYLPTYQEETTTTTQITTTTSTTTTTEATVPATTTQTEEPTETWHWIHLSNLNLEAGDTVTVLLSESGEMMTLRRSGIWTIPARLTVSMKELFQETNTPFPLPSRNLLMTSTLRCTAFPMYGAAPT